MVSQNRLVCKQYGITLGSLAAGRLKFFIMSTAKLYHNGQRVSQSIVWGVESIVTSVDKR